MSKPKHTSGPWYTGQTVGLRRYVLDDKQNKIAKIESFGNAGYVHGELIAAAPELLEVVATIYTLANLQTLLETKYSKTLVNDIMKQLHSALNKARGES